MEKENLKMALQPTMLYGLECWRIKRHVQKISAAEKRMFETESAT